MAVSILRFHYILYMLYGVLALYSPDSQRFSTANSNFGKGQAVTKLSLSTTLAIFSA